MIHILFIEFVIYSILGYIFEINILFRGKRKITKYCTFKDFNLIKCMQNIYLPTGQYIYGFSALILLLLNYTLPNTNILLLSFIGVILITMLECMYGNMLKYWLYSTKIFDCC